MIFSNFAVLKLFLQVFVYGNMLVTIHRIAYYQKYYSVDRGPCFVHISLPLFNQDTSGILNTLLHLHTLWFTYNFNFTTFT